MVCPYGSLYVTHVGGKGGSNKRKKHVLENVFFSWFAHTGLYVTHVGGKGESNKRKKHILENVVFSWFAHTGLYVTHVGGKGGSAHGNAQISRSKSWTKQSQHFLAQTKFDAHDMQQKQEVVGCLLVNW